MDSAQEKRREKILSMGKWTFVFRHGVLLWGALFLAFAATKFILSDEPLLEILFPGILSHGATWVLVSLGVWHALAWTKKMSKG